MIILTLKTLYTLMGYHTKVEKSRGSSGVLACGSAGVLAYWSAGVNEIRDYLWCNSCNSWKINWIHEQVGNDKRVRE